MVPCASIVSVAFRCGSPRWAYSYIINKSNDGKPWKRNKKSRKGWRFTAVMEVLAARGRLRKWAFARPVERAGLWKKLNPSAKSPVRVAVKRTLSYVPSSKASEKKGRILALFSCQIGIPCPPLALRHISLFLHGVAPCKERTWSSIINLAGLSRRRVCRINAKIDPLMSAVSFFLFLFFMKDVYVI